MALLKQSTIYTRMFLLVLSSDHVSPATGKSPTVNLSKAGGSFAAAGGTITEVANGWYKIALTTTDTNTLGDLAFNCTAASCDNTDFADQVGTLDVNTISISGTTQTARDLGASVLLSAGTGTGQLDFASGIVKSNLSQVLGGTCPATSVTGVPKVDVQDIAGAAVSTSSAQIGVNAVQIGGAVPGSATIGTVTNLTNAPTSGDFTSTMKTSLNAATVTVGTNNDKTGYSLSALESPIVESGTAQAGGVSTITLRAGASATDNLYLGLMIRIYGGAGAGQARVITGYVGSTQIATVDNSWAVNPDNTSTYAIVGHEAPQLDATGSVKIQIPLKRNTAQPVFPFTMRDTNGNLVSGLTVAAQITIDGAAFVPSTNAPTQLGGGWYLLNLAAADLDGTAIGLRFTAAGAVTKDIQIFTQP